MSWWLWDRYIIDASSLVLQVPAATLSSPSLGGEHPPPSFSLSGRRCSISTWTQ